MGVSVADLRELEKDIGTNHELAGELWDTDIHEARKLASMVGDPEKVTEEQMEDWVAGVDSWDLCDQLCNNLFSRTALAETKAREWVSRDEEFVKRAGFVLIAALSANDEGMKESEFEQFLALIEKEADDDRKYVRKGAAWAMKEIGKRSSALERKTIEAARRMEGSQDTAREWIANEVLEEFDA